MAAYTIVADIKGYYLGYDPTTSDYLTEEIVEGWITEKSNSIDMILRQKYTLPITNVNDLLFIKSELCEKMVVALIDDVMRLNKATDGENSVFARQRNYGKEADETFKLLIRGDIALESPQKSNVAMSYRRNPVT